MENAPVQTSFVGQFNEIHKMPAADRPSAYKPLLSQIISTPESLEHNLIAYAISLLGSERPIVSVVAPSEPLSMVSSRPLLSAFISDLERLPSTPIKLAVSNDVLNLIAPRVVSFEEQDTQIKLLRAAAFEEDEDFADSARTLQTVSLDSTARAVTDTDRAQIWVRIVRCYLEEDDPVAALGYVNRIKQIAHNVSDATTLLQFRMSMARILDSQRQFLEASNAYHLVSFEPSVDEDDRLQTLSAAISCAVLAPAGPQRARALAKLYKDDRAPQVQAFPILEKIFLDRVLTPDEVAAFAARLPQHQLARTSDGSTVLERAVLEHNLLGASRLYRNIGCDELGTLLGVSGDRAEQYAAQMIEQGRLAGYIDQIARVIFFADSVANGQQQGQQNKGAQVKVGAMELRRWDANVQGLAEEVEKVTTMIQAQHPDFYEANMAH